MDALQKKCVFFEKGLNMDNKGKLDFVLEENPYYKLSKIDTEKYQKEFWDVSETIIELAYLTQEHRGRFSVFRGESFFFEKSE